MSRVSLATTVVLAGVLGSLSLSGAGVASATADPGAVALDAAGPMVRAKAVSPSPSRLGMGAGWKKQKKSGCSLAKECRSVSWVSGAGATNKSVQVEIVAFHRTAQAKRAVNRQIRMDNADTGTHNERHFGWTKSGPVKTAVLRFRYTAGNAPAVLHLWSRKGAKVVAVSYVRGWDLRAQPGEVALLRLSQRLAKAR